MALSYIEKAHQRGEEELSRDKKVGNMAVVAHRFSRNSWSPVPKILTDEGTKTSELVLRFVFNTDGLSRPPVWRSIHFLSLWRKMSRHLSQMHSAALFHASPHNEGKWKFMLRGGGWRHKLWVNWRWSTALFSINSESPSLWVHAGQWGGRPWQHQNTLMGLNTLSGVGTQLKEASQEDNWAISISLVHCGL